MLKNKDCLHFLGHFFSLELWGSRVTDRALESAKNGFLVKKYPSSPSIFGGCPSSRGTTLIFMIMYYMNGLCSAAMCIVVVVVW